LHISIKAAALPSKFAFDLTMAATIVHMATGLFEEAKDYPPHAWLDDPRLPLFTFTWDDREFGFYAMSITYWTEILVVGTNKLVNVS